MKPISNITFLAYFSGQPLRLAFLLLATSLVFHGFLARAAYSVPTNGLIGCWLGDGNPADTSPVGNGGSFGGNFAFGPTGRAFNLGSGKVIIPNNPAYDFTSYDGWSVGFWFNGNGNPINENNGLFLGQDNGGGFQPKWFIDYAYSVYAINSSFNFHVNDFNQERIFAGSQPLSPATGWSHLAVTINNTNSGTVSFYLNGQPLGSGAMGNYVLRTTAPLVFGQAEGLTFNGLMSGVVIYNRVLSTNEISQLATIPPLTITNQPSSASVSSGGAVTFTVGATGPGPLTYQWMFNGTNINAATNTSLTLTSITPHETGVYTVAVTNAFQSVVSSPALLTTVDIKLFAGILVNGVIGSNYVFQATPELGSNWMVLTNIALPSSPYIYIDFTSITNAARMYKVFVTQ